MGSFPIILKFDSLGRYLCIILAHTCYMYFYIFRSFFLTNLPNRLVSKKLSTQLSFNSFKNNHQIFFKNNFFEKLFKNKLNKLTLICINLFFFKKNVLFIDYNYNYNYIPLSQNSLNKCSPKDVFKLIEYFDINMVIFFNLNNKRSIFKKFFNLDILNISSHSNQKNFNFNLGIPNVPILHYIIYVYISQIYLKINNNGLNISG